VKGGPSLEHDWFPAALPDNIEIGSDSWLFSSYAFLHCRSRQTPAVRIGASCGVYDGTFFELGPRGRVEIGDCSAIVGVIFSTNSTVSIGRGCFIAHEVVMADRAVMTPPGDDEGAAADIVIGDDVWIGMGVTIVGGVRIGDGAVIGAGAVIDRDVPAMTVAAGNPARIVGTVPLDPPPPNGSRAEGA
jgi:acetyltransferase-like isoleucine patch superfamily enzyme